VKRFRDFIGSSFVSGVLVVLPLYLIVLLALKGIKQLTGLARPIAVLHPRGWPQAVEDALALLIVFVFCVGLGVALRSRFGRAARERIEESILVKVPAYELVRDLTQQLAGQGRANAWKPAFAEMGGGLVVAFIIEELDDGRYTVFIPSVPSPVRGSVYVLPRKNVHPTRATLPQTLQALSRWGSGIGKLVVTIDSPQSPVQEVTRRAG
jgi:uncharacterized membrane protein